MRPGPATAPVPRPRRVGSPPDVSCPQAQVPGGERRRGRAGHLQGPGDHAARPAQAAGGLPGGGEGHGRPRRLHLHPRGVLQRSLQPAGGGERPTATPHTLVWLGRSRAHHLPRCRWPSVRRTRLGCWAATPAGRVTPLMCLWCAVPAPTSAGKRRRSSSPSRASRGSLASSPPSLLTWVRHHSSVLNSQLLPLNNCPQATVLLQGQHHSQHHIP